MSESLERRVVALERLSDVELGQGVTLSEEERVEELERMVNRGLLSRVDGVWCSSSEEERYHRIAELLNVAERRRRGDGCG